MLPEDFGLSRSYAAAVTNGWRSTDLPGVMRRAVQVRTDVRGSFGEVWRASSTAPVGVGTFVQANLSNSGEGVLRGVHFHLRQTDMWVVLDGRAHVCLVDLRDLLAGESAAPKAVTEVYQPGDAVLIPEGVAHGFWALDPVSLLYLVTNEYDGTDEHGFAWDDPDAAVVWPPGEPTLSDRDAAAPSLAEAVAVAQAQGSGQTSSR
jgi:dTDP-4-dehydrorhamnose 3,5-epimerase